MTDKEKQAYNFFKECNQKDLENFDYFSEPSKLQIKYMKTILNLIESYRLQIIGMKHEIEKQQTEIKKYKEMYAVSVADRVNSAFKQEYKNNEDLEMLYNGCQIELEEKDKIIDEMAHALKGYANLGVLIKCPAEYDGKYNYKYCKIDITKDRTEKTRKICINCIKEYFKNKVNSFEQN